MARTILHQIVDDKKRELEIQQGLVTLSQLELRISGQPAPLSLASALKGDSIRLIAEVKRASPSKGSLCPGLDPAALAQTYIAGGAAAISLLTESTYFHGSLDDVAAVKEALSIPVLRKDFVFDPYQIYESCAFGADGLLLIVAILEDKQLSRLLDLSHKLGMRCLVEVHNEDEVQRALAAGAQIIGINNRDLHTFSVDLSTTERLCRFIPNDRIVVSESGIRSRQDVQKLIDWGIDAFLVGEALVTAHDVAAKMRELMS